MPRCLNCKSKFISKVFLQKFCDSEDCVDAKIDWSIQQVRKQKQKSWSKEKSELKEKVKTLSDWNNDLQKEVNAIVRLLDFGHPCISSQRQLGRSYDAGHFYGRQSYPELRFNLLNIYAQSVHDNQHKSGNPLGYMDGLKLTFGSEHLEIVMGLRSSGALKLSEDEIRRKIPIARSIIKWIKLQERQFTTEERLELRKKFNHQLGIYN